MSDLTTENILNELGKLRDNTGRAMSFAEGQTIVPNTLLTQVWEEAERKERERIIKLLENPYFHNIQFPDIHIDCEMCITIKLIKGEQK